MKRLLLCFSLALFIALSSIAQERATIRKDRRDIAVKKAPYSMGDRSGPTFENPALKSIMSPEETQIGDSWYDWQTNASMQNRLYYFDDGTFGGTWMNGYNYDQFDDRGTAYTYYDGNEWDDFPVTRVESQRSGWGNYWPLGENGEIIISHISGGQDDGLLINRRTEKGEGEWDEYLFEGPVGGESIIWPYCITTGIDNNTIHLLAVTRPIVNGGTLYEGIDGALLYSRSSDGGETWEIRNEILPQLTSDDFTHFDPDSYVIAPPRNGVLAFVVGSPFNEAFLMKSTDNGDTWEKTVIWEHPYPMWVNEITDTFYCVDGSWDIKLDNNGMAHCVFGINRAHADGSGTFWFPFHDGVGYWNETMPTFSGTHEALNPYGEEGTELFEDYNLIGWTQDMDGDGEITMIGYSNENIGKYYLGLSSMVQLVMGESNQLYVLFSSGTETYDNGLQNFRHLWARVSPDGGTTWGHFTHLTEELVHIFDECVWISAANKSDPNTLYLIYQYDGEPGMAMAGDEDGFAVNYWSFMEIDKDEITSIKEVATDHPPFTVHQNYPNPYTGKTTVRIDLEQKSTLVLDVVNVVGQLVFTSTEAEKPAGSHSFTIQSEGLPKGVYFYTVSAGNYKITKKMIIE